MGTETPPYCPFYFRDFASDARVEAMSTEAVGAYILLLCKAWFETPGGTLPDNDTLLAKWARVRPRTWAIIKPQVMAPFVLNGDRWHQKRMCNEHAKAVALVQKRSNAGKAGAQQRHGNRITNADDCFSTHAGARASGSGSGSDSGSPLVGGGVGEPAMPPALAVSAEFVEAWVAYVRHRSELGERALGPSAVQAQWARLLGWGVERATAALRNTVAMGWKNIRETDDGHSSGRAGVGAGSRGAGSASGIERGIAAQRERDALVGGAKPELPDA